MQKARKAASAGPARRTEAATATTSTAETIVPTADSASVQGTAAIGARERTERDDRERREQSDRTARSRPRVARQQGAEHQQERAPADERRRLIEESRRRRNVEGDQRRQRHRDDRARDEQRPGNDALGRRGDRLRAPRRRLHARLTVTSDAIGRSSGTSIAATTAKRGMIRATEPADARDPLPSGHRRPARGRGARRRLLPRVAACIDRRLRRRRRVLRHQRIPDHADRPVAWLHVRSISTAGARAGCCRRCSSC